MRIAKRESTKSIMFPVFIVSLMVCVLIVMLFQIHIELSDKFCGYDYIFHVEYFCIVWEIHVGAVGFAKRCISTNE